LDESETWVYFFNLGQPEKVAHFYENNPAIIHTDEGLKGLIGVSYETGSRPDSLNDITHRYSCNGLHGFIVITPQGEIS